MQIHEKDRQEVETLLIDYNLSNGSYFLEKAIKGNNFVIKSDGKVIFKENRTTLRMLWAETTWQIQRLRDNKECADQEYKAKANDNDPGLNVKLTFNINDNISAPYIASRVRPKLAVLREQGTNSHVEMASAFHRADF